jgi:parvulin-like peptidyl-prolyl isomerase
MSAADAPADRRTGRLTEGGVWQAGGRRTPLKETPHVTRAPRTLAAAGLVALLLTGCGGTVRAGAAATVGDERITVADLREVVERGLKDPSAQQTVGADRAGFERSTLGRLIQHLVLERAARDNGVTVSGAEVDRAFDVFAQQLGGEQELRAAAHKAGISDQDLPTAIRDAAVRDALADKLTVDLPVSAADLAGAYQADIAQYDQVHSAHILVPTEAQARQILGRVQAAPASFPAEAARFSQDTSNKANGGDLGFQGRGALEKSFETAIFTAKPGSFVLAKTSFGWHVIHVIERRTTSLEEAAPQLRRNILAQQRELVIQDVLTKTAKKLGVHVSPRFGSWDPSTEEVVATPVCDDAVSSPSPRAAQDAAAPQPTEQPDC